MTILIIYLYIAFCSGAGCYLADSKERALGAVLFGLLWPVMAPIFLFARLYGE